MDKVIPTKNLIVEGYISSSVMSACLSICLFLCAVFQNF